MGTEPAESANDGARRGRGAGKGSFRKGWNSDEGQGAAVCRRRRRNQHSGHAGRQATRQLRGCEMNRTKAGDVGVVGTGKCCQDAH